MSDIIRLVTSADRAAQEEAEYADAAHAEAVEMLERAANLLRDRKVGAIAIAFAMDDGSYGHLLPVAGNRIGHLVGAIADMQHALLTKTER